MKYRNLLPLAALAVLLPSCASQSGGDDYDVSNPYAAPDYKDDAGTPYQTPDVNPAYDTPAVYEDTTPAVPEAPAQVAKVHTVVRGDSLWKIAKQYSVSVDAIKTANGLTSDTAVLGAKLQIPAR
jgi:LysM repeat protein